MFNDKKEAKKERTISEQQRQDQIFLAQSELLKFGTIYEAFYVFYKKLLDEKTEMQLKLLIGERDGEEESAVLEKVSQNLEEALTYAGAAFSLLKEESLIKEKAISKYGLEQSTMAIREEDFFK